MFVVCTPEQSEALHQQLLDLEVQMFTELGLHFQVGERPSRGDGPAFGFPHLVACRKVLCPVWRGSKWL